MLHPENIKLLIVHCSDTPNDQYTTAKDIHLMHLNFGWDGIGYHKVICRDGTIENGRPEYWIGAHVKNKNKTSLGVCLIGKDDFTDEQYISLKKILTDWKIIYPSAKIKGHKDSTKTLKTCPNFNVDEWCKMRGVF